MAIPKEYIERNVNALKGLRANKNSTRFFYRFKVYEKEFTLPIDYSNKAWSKKQRRDKAREEAYSYKERKKNEFDNVFTIETKMDELASEYFEKKCIPSVWTDTRKQHYNDYIKPFIGNKRVSKIIENDIDTIRLYMQTHGKTRQNKNGNSYRSIEKVLMQVLKPILVYGESNNALSKLPPVSLPKGMKLPEKKEVTHATEKFLKLYTTILKLYGDDPFYCALYLMALFGRRWNEIRTLTWDEIDLPTSSYTIPSTFNKIKKSQTYIFPDLILEQLLKIPDDRIGLVFKSPRTGGMLSSPKRRTARLREESGIEELTMHYFRHIMVSAGADHDAPEKILNAALGHERDSKVLNDHYVTREHTNASASINNILKNIINGDTSSIKKQPDYYI